MNKKYEWNLKEIFENREEFNKTKENMEQDLRNLKTYQGKLCENSENLYEAYYLYEKALEKYEKLYAYGMLFTI